jgi:hypothetical protein
MGMQEDLPCKLGIRSSRGSLPQNVLTSDEGQDTVRRVFISYPLRPNLEIGLFGSWHVGLIIGEGWQTLGHR